MQKSLAQALITGAFFTKMLNKKVSQSVHCRGSGRGLSQ